LLKETYRDFHMIKKVLLLSAIIFLLLLVLLSQWFFPADEFSIETLPSAPDYKKSSSWAALPNKKDNADIVPGTDGEGNKQSTALVDVFYLYPTSYILGREWNAALDNKLANFIVDNGILSQQASAFNGVAKVYAPRYRQVSLGGQMQQENVEDKLKALALAYSDVQAAFDYYMANHNEGRPFLIASHSQGTTHAKPLIKYLFTQYPEQSKNLIAAYIIGNTVLHSELEDYLGVCETPLQTNCYLSWNSVLDGGDIGHWNTGGQTLCVNPLSWERDSEFVNADQNLGAIPLTGHIGLKQVHKNLVGARCENGILWITKPDEWIYKLALFPGGGYHAYDYNLFYMNIRENVEQRVAGFLGEKD
jgi:hypothetical protein